MCHHTCSAEAASDHPRSQRRCHQRLSEAAGGHQRSPEELPKCQGPPDTARCRQRPPPCTGRQRPQEIARGCQRPRETARAVRGRHAEVAGGHLRRPRRYPGGPACDIQRTPCRRPGRPRGNRSLPRIARRSPKRCPRGPVRQNDEQLRFNGVPFCKHHACAYLERPTPPF